MLLTALPVVAQQQEILVDDLAALTVLADDDWQAMPIIPLQGKTVTIAFDELSHDYHRYRYTIEHCEADWSVSTDLFPSDFLEGFYDDNIITDYALSEGTYQLYTHYELTLPNAHCRPTMSGNYRVTIIDDDTDEPVARASFLICDNDATVTLGYTTNTDIDINLAHQQITMEVDYSRLRVTNPDQQLTVVVVQNQRYDNAVIDPKVTYKSNHSLRWDHCHELIFAAGNEYHKFETLDPTHSTMGLSAVGWDKENRQWHAYVNTDEPRRNYIYDVDANGAFLIRNSDNYDCSTTCDYILTHFTLAIPRVSGTIYLSGRWTYGLLTPDYELTWNYMTNAYEAVVPLKQGYYSYTYLLLTDDGTVVTLPTEGNFFQTENEYTALVYYRSPADRATRLVAHNTIYTGN